MNQPIIDKLFQLKVADWILLGAFIFLFLSRLYYLLFFTGRVLWGTRKEVIANEVSTKPVSVLLTVRNEEKNLQRILPQLLAFNTVKYEVIAVDDYSLDNTYSVLGYYKQKYPHFRISSLNEETRFSVKLAQNIALKAAKYDWVLLCPVEAIEVNDNWIGGFTVSTGIKNRNVLIAYSGLKPKAGFYNLLCRLEMFSQQIRSAGFISNGVPFVYSEDNVAFNRQEYFNLGGYGSKTKEAYANLELIINKFIAKKQTAVLFNDQTRLTKDVETGKDDYYNLLRKSFRIESYLPFWKRLILNIELISSLLYLPMLLVVIAWFFELWPIISALAGVKILTHLIILKIVQKRLNEDKIFIPSLMYSLLVPYYKMFYRWHSRQQSRRQKWKTKV